MEIIGIGHTLLYYVFSEAPFQWEDGSTVDFTYWAPGEPNDQDGTSNCVRMYVNDIGPELATRWDDYTCGSDYENGYVCKVPQGVWNRCLAINALQ